MNWKHHLGREAKEQLTQQAQKMTYLPGQVLHPRTEQNDYRFCFIETGVVQQFRYSIGGEKLTLALIFPGECFGLTSISKSASDGDFFSAIERTTSYEVTRKKLYDLIEIYPDVAECVLQLICKATHQTEGFIQSIQFLSTDARIANLLLNLADRAGEKIKIGTIININLSQQELGTMVGASRTTTSLCLNRLKREKILCYIRNKICIIDFCRLQSISIQK